jgi:nitrite reductase/ring-hydroxylating ferredoxin subunit
MQPGKRYDLPTYTNGWFQIAWSDDLTVGQLRKVRHFGRELTLFRGKDGRPGVIDDTCPHLGAHFSEGGCVVGNSVQCPYHHWQFDAAGQCTAIPYAKKIPVKARVRSYPTVERHGMIFLFRHASAGVEPHELPEIEGFHPPDYARPERYEFAIRVHGQDIMENSVDSPHFWAVHGHNMPENEFRAEGRVLRITQRTSLQRFGTQLKARLEFHMIEPGFHYIHFPEMPGRPALVFSSIVPQDDEITIHRLTIWVKRSPVPGLTRLIRRFLLWQMMQTYQEDKQIWEHKEYHPHPVLCDGDGSIMKLRTWYRQFYDPAELEARAAPAPS